MTFPAVASWVRFPSTDEFRLAGRTPLARAGLDPRVQELEAHVDPLESILDRLLEFLQDGELALDLSQQPRCRMKAPRVRTCFALLAHIRGTLVTTF